MRRRSPSGIGSSDQAEKLNINTDGKWPVSFSSGTLITYSTTAAQTLLADSRRLVFPCVTMSLDDVAKREEKIIQKARNAIGETDKIRIQTLQMMRDWIQKQPHLSTCPTSEFSRLTPLDISINLIIEFSWYVPSKLCSCVQV